MKRLLRFLFSCTLTVWILLLALICSTFYIVNFKSNTQLDIMYNKLYSSYSKRINGNDISYAELNKYDLQSTLMLRPDYFNQGLSPSDFAFSLGIALDSVDMSNSTIDSSKSNFWINKWMNYFIKSFREKRKKLDYSYFIDDNNRFEFSLTNIGDVKEELFAITDETIYKSMNENINSPFFVLADPTNIGLSGLIFNSKYWPKEALNTIGEFKIEKNGVFYTYKINPKYLNGENVRLAWVFSAWRWLAPDDFFIVTEGHEDNNSPFTRIITSDPIGTNVYFLKVDNPHQWNMNFKLKYQYLGINYIFNKTFLGKDMSLNPVDTSNFKQVFNLFFTPLVQNQSLYSFDSNFLLFNFDFAKALHENELWKNIKDSSGNTIKTYDLAVKGFNQYYSNLMRSIFDLNSNTSVDFVNNVDSNLNFSFFVKNGFMLYPKSLIIIAGDTNTRVGSNRGNIDLNITFETAYGIDYEKGKYYYYLSKGSDTYNFYHHKSKFEPSIFELKDVKGFNVVKFATRNIRLAGFNFSIYNSADWNNTLNGGDIWKIPYKSCGITNLFGCIQNGFIWLFNNIPGVDFISKFVNGIISVFENVMNLFNDISPMFNFNITFKIMLSSLLVLAMLNGLLRYF